MQYVLMGFDQDAGVRLYAFRGVADGASQDFTVGVDLSVINRYGIRIQELPLLCRKLLEQQLVAEHALTLTETDMRNYAGNSDSAREAAGRQRKTAPKPAVEVPGGTQLPQAKA